MKSPMFLSFLAACVDKNCCWFILSLLFEKVVFLQLDDANFKDNNRSNKGNAGGKSEVGFGVKDKYIYQKNNNCCKSTCTCNFLYRWDIDYYIFISKNYLFKFLIYLQLDFLG